MGAQLGLLGVEGQGSAFTNLRGLTGLCQQRQRPDEMLFKHMPMMLCGAKHGGCAP